MGQICGTNKNNIDVEHPFKQLLQQAWENEELKQIESLSDELNIDWDSYSILQDQTASHIGSYLYQTYLDTITSHSDLFHETIYCLLYLHCKKYIVDNKLEFKENNIRPKHFYLSSEYALNTPKKSAGDFEKSTINCCKMFKTYKYGIYNKTYCIKLQKQTVLELDATTSVGAVKNEIKFLKELKRCPFVLDLYYVLFDGKHNIYCVYDWIFGGDLKDEINRSKRFTNKQTQFYAAQLLIALNYIHSKGMIYRDLKLENILLSQNGYIKLCDFTLAIKLKDSKKGKDIANIEQYIILNWTRSIASIDVFPQVLMELILAFKGRSDVIRGYAGTPGYVAPESILGNYYNQSVDLFALGALIYRCLSGQKPFRKRTKPHNARREDKRKKAGALDRNCLEMTILFRDQYFDALSKNIIKGLLCKNVAHRLGNYDNSDISEVFEHPYFGGIDWNGIENQTIVAPYVPVINESVGETEKGKCVVEKSDIKHNYNTRTELFMLQCEGMYYVYENHLEDHVMEILQNVLTM